MGSNGHMGYRKRIAQNHDALWMGIIDWAWRWFRGRGWINKTGFLWGSSRTMNTSKQDKLQNHTSASTRETFIQALRFLSIVLFVWAALEINCGVIGGQLQASGCLKIQAWRLLTPLSRLRVNLEGQWNVINVKTGVDTLWETWYNHCPVLTTWSGFSQKR